MYIYVYMLSYAYMYMNTCIHGWPVKLPPVTLLNTIYVLYVYVCTGITLPQLPCALPSTSSPIASCPLTLTLTPQVGGTPLCSTVARLRRHAPGQVASAWEACPPLATPRAHAGVVSLGGEPRDVTNRRGVL